MMLIRFGKVLCFPKACRAQREDLTSHQARFLQINLNDLITNFFPNIIRLKIIIIYKISKKMKYYIHV